jgi:TolB-like protein/DNA-binding SARP family transcriptional activator/Flp pilus assembly protein TadD
LSFGCGDRHVIRLRTLGALDLRGSDGKELDGVLVQPKRVALLCYLALATPRGPHRRDTLLPLFWPEHDTQHARNSLSQSIHVLRRSLGPDAVLSGGDTLSLAWGDLWCDVVAFEEALDDGRLVDAVELYGGELLEGFHLASAPEFERWLESERERLARRYATAVEELATEREAAGDVRGAAIWWRRLAARDPYSSRPAVGLMRALAAAGDPAGAVQHARVHETLLREELNVAPDPEVAALVRQLESRSGGAAHDSRAHLIEPAPLEEAARTSTPSPDPPAVRAAGPARDSSRTRPSRLRRPIVFAAAVLVLVAVAVAITRETRASSMPTIRSIAVLPLENLSGDSTQQPFADGMHDALISELARYPGLSVISRTSVMQYRGTKKRLPEIARELNVDGIIEGAVLHEAGKVRMTAQLVHGPSDRHLWAQSYRRDLRDILVLQSELAEAIAREVRVAATPPERRRPTFAGSADSAPKELYLKELYRRGKNAELSRSLAGLQTAKEYYRRAIERDSNFALGYAGLAGAHEIMAFYDFSPVGTALDSARIMARRAIALDSTLPETRTAFAISLVDDGELEAAEREFKRALELGPSNASAHYWYSMLLVALGRGEEALREAERGLELDPFSPRGALGMKYSALYLISGERQSLKLPVSERRPILKLEPGEPWARARQAIELAEEERCAEARADIVRARQLAPGDNIRMLSLVGAVYWLCGERARARALLAEMKRHPHARDHAIVVANLHARFGEKDSAFVWLGRQQRWMLARRAFLSADRLIDPLRSDPRFPELLERLQLRPQHARQN